MLNYDILGGLMGLASQYEFFISVPLQMFFVLTPFAVVPIFLGMTPNAKPEERIHIIRITCWVAFAVLMFFAFTGQLIFTFFGVDKPAFQVAAGLLLFFIGFDMLRAKDSDAKDLTEEEKKDSSKLHDIAITPMAVPLIAGPATISFIIMTQGEAKTTAEGFTVYASIIINMIAVYWILRLCSKGAQWLNPFVLKLIRRLTGLVLSSMAVQIVLKGLVELRIISDFTKF